jgi:protein phosphatase
MHFRPIVSAKSDVGRAREHNEDKLLVASELRLYAVADGMGGHDAGDVASALAAATLDEFFRFKQRVPKSIQLKKDLAPGAQRLLAAVCEANSEVIARNGGEAAAGKGGMGTTIVAAFIPRDATSIHIAHAGDSRCYRLRDGKLTQLTRDHNMLNDALRLNPKLDPKIRDEIPKNVITRALGMRAELEAEVRSEVLEHEDIFLLCSDGLTGALPDDTIGKVLQAAGDNLQKACDHLIALANKAGGDDNISVLLIRAEALVSLHPVSEEPPDSQRELTPPSDDERSAPPPGAPPPGAPPPGAPPPGAPPRKPPPGAARKPPPGRRPPPPGRRPPPPGRKPPPPPRGRRPARGRPAPQPQVARCRKCGQELYAGTEACLACGTPHDFFS